jgi:hypothetical protein
MTAQGPVGASVMPRYGSDSDTRRVLYRGPLQHDERVTPCGAKTPLALVLGPPSLTPFGGPFTLPCISFPLQLAPNPIRAPDRLTEFRLRHGERHPQNPSRSIRTAARQP